MLILSRKTGQAVYLDDTTEIRILDIRGGRDREGISAPRRVTISRGELFKQPTLPREPQIATSANFSKTE